MALQIHAFLFVQALLFPDPIPKLNSRPRFPIAGKASHRRSGEQITTLDRATVEYKSDVCSARP